MPYTISRKDIIPYNQNNIISMSDIIPIRTISFSDIVPIEEEEKKQAQGYPSGNRTFTDLGFIGGESTPVHPVKEFMRGSLSSVPGMMYRKQGPEPSEAKNFIEKAAYGAGQMLFDAPVFAAGMYGGGLPGGFAATAGIRKTLMDAYEKGNAKTFEEFLPRLGGAMKETVKGGITGAVTEIAGAGRGFAAIPKQTVAMTTTGAVLEKRFPTAQEFIDNAVLMFGIHGVMSGSRALRNYYTTTGKTPTQVYEDVKAGKVNPDAFINEWGVEANAQPQRGGGILPDVGKSPIAKPNKYRFGAKPEVKPKPLTQEQIREKLKPETEMIGENVRPDFQYTLRREHEAGIVEGQLNRPFPKGPMERTVEPQKPIFEGYEKVINPEAFESAPSGPGSLPELIIGKPVKPKRIATTTTGKKLEQPAIPREPLDNSAEAVTRMYEEHEAQIAALGKKSWRHRLQDLKRVTVDTSANIKNQLLKDFGIEGKEAVIRHDLIKGAHSKAIKIYDEVSKQIYEGLSPDQEITLNRVIQSRNTINVEQRRPDILQPGGFRTKGHTNFLNSIEPNLLADLNRRADIYANAWKEQLDALKGERIISETAYNYLVDLGFYSPRKFIDYIDPEHTVMVGGRKITVTESGIKRLDTGSESALENNSRLLLSDGIARVQGRIFRNKANMAMRDIALKNPDNGIVRMLAEKEKLPGGYQEIRVMVDGNPERMAMPNRLAREWVVSDPQISAELANTIGWVTGSKVLKASATGYNPEFAFTNLPRDIAHIWGSTYEFSSHAPVAGLQMGRNLLTTLTDSWGRKGRWNDYIDEGGGMEFLTHQGRLKAPQGLSPYAAQLQKVLSYVGETSEIWTRLSLREQALRNGKSPVEATWTARNYLDFSQGGSYIKAVDTAVPYLNAGVQGTRGLFRAAAQRPGEFTYKIAQLGSFATGLFLANRLTNPDTWNNISDRDKVNNFIITTPGEYTDKQGNKRYLFYKIPKDQSQRLMSTIFENMMAKYMGDPVNIDQVTQAAKDMIQIMPGELLPPTFGAALGYFSNKDFWKNEDIWKEGYDGAIEPGQEYTAYTNPALVKWGEATGMSPERTKYALSELFAYQNIYTDLVGGGMRQIFKQMDEPDRERTTKEMLLRMPVIRKVFKATNPFMPYEKSIKETMIKENTRTFVRNREFNKILNSDSLDQAAAGEFIKTQPDAEKPGLWAKYKEHERMKDIPDRRWWVNLKAAPPEVRANMYWDRYINSTEDEQKSLEYYMKRVPGIYTDRFAKRMNHLVKKAR